MRILFFTADSQYAEPAPDGPRPGAMKEYARLDLWPELERVTDTLFDARAEGRVELTVVPEASRGDIHRYLNELPVDVVHFSGHGDRVQPNAGDQAAAEGGTEQEAEHHLVLMADNHEGLFGEYTPNEWIREQLRGKEVKLLVLNCCWSAGVAEALDGAAECIIGTEFEVRSDRAAEFAECLYRELERGLTIRQIRDVIQSRKEFENYQFRVRDEKALDLALQPVPPEERTVSPPRAVLEKRSEVELLHASHRFLFKADLFKLAFALIVAFGGYALFALAGEWDRPPGEVPEGPGEILSFLATKASWLKWEPGAIVTALYANPLGRIAAYLQVEAGVLATLAALRTLSLKAPAAVERYLATGRIDAMIHWLKECQK